MRKQSIYLLAAAVALTLAGSGTADIVHLKNGQKQTGLVTLDRADLPTISLRTSGGEIAIRRDRISQVEKEPKAISYMRLGDQYLEKRMYREANEAYESAIALDKNNADIAAKLKEAKAGLAAIAEEAKGQTDTKLTQSMDKAMQLVSEKKFQEAAELMRSVEPQADSPRMAEFKKTNARVYYEWGLDRADRQDMAGAAEKLQMSLRLDPENETAKAQLAIVWEGDPSKQHEVAEFYKAGDSPADQLKLADVYFKNRKYEEALPIYLKYVNDPKLGTAQIQTRVRTIYDTLHRQYADEGNYRKASEVYQAFLQFSPNEDLRPLVRYEYMLRRAQTDMNDPNERVNLAKWAEEHGLPDTAKSEYQNVLQMAPKNEAAKAGLKRYADEDMRDVTDFVAEKQYMLATNKAQEIARTYPMFPELVQQAQATVSQLAQQQQQDAANRQQQAQGMALRGDEYYQQALSYLSAMVSTNVDQRTRVFSPKVEATRNLQRALYAWQSALSIDPSLGDPTSHDLRRKIQDAYTKWMVLTYPYAPPPIRRN